MVSGRWQHMSENWLESTLIDNRISFDFLHMSIGSVGRIHKNDC